MTTAGSLGPPSVCTDQPGLGLFTASATPAQKTATSKSPNTTNQSDGAKMGKWLKAGVRADPDEREKARCKHLRERNEHERCQAANEPRARRQWELGRMVPAKITHALNRRKLFGPEVDAACGAEEPDVDLWETGEKYPTWEQVEALAKLTDFQPIFFFNPTTHIDIRDTSLWLHMNHTERSGFDHSPPVITFLPEAIAKTLGKL